MAMFAEHALRVVGFWSLLAAATAPSQAEEGAGAAASCPLQTFAAGSLGSVTDGRTFALADGTTVRLAAIDVPQMPRAGENDGQTGLGVAAKAALEGLLAGNEIVLKRSGIGSDRYGQAVAHVFVARGGWEYWIEREMIAAGHARVAARSGDRACSAPLLLAERQARGAKLGLWADPFYAMKGADNAAGLLLGRGRFTVVEGQVATVRESGGVIYVNFGRVWSRNLTVTILKRNERAFAAAGIEPKKLESRRIRVRGWIEERGGPRMEAARPEQIEIAEQD